MPEILLAVALALAALIAVLAGIRIARRPRRVWLWVVALLLALAAMGCVAAAWWMPASVGEDGSLQEQFWLIPAAYLLTGFAVTVAIVALAVARGPRQVAP